MTIKVSIECTVSTDSRSTFSFHVEENSGLHLCYDSHAIVLPIVIESDGIDGYLLVMKLKHQQCIRDGRLEIALLEVTLLQYCCK